MIGLYVWSSWQRALVAALRARAKRNQKPILWGNQL